MIILQKVTKNFGSTIAVNNVTLEVKRGEIFGLVGPDSSGKTTIIRMLTGLISPTSGTLNIFNTANLEMIKNKIGYVPQKFSLYGDLTVIENIRAIGALYGQESTVIDEIANHILSFTKLLPFKNRLVNNLSGGMKQKLALAAALVHKPEIFFLDEPTTGVDPVSRREFWQMLYQLNKEGMTIFVSTPYMDEAELCTRVAFIHHGVITTCDSPRELRKSYPYQIIELATPERNIKKILIDDSIIDINAFGTKYHLVVNDAATAIVRVKSILGEMGISITSLTQIQPNLEDIFVALASEVA
jgi:ABC-2 type transport system ATP-binding protein